MKDYATNTEHDAGRWEAQHADRDSDYDASDDTLSGPGLPIDDATRATVARVVDDLKVPCGICPDRLWSPQAAKVHRDRRHGA